MLELKNLVFEVPADDGGTKRIIDDLSLTIPDDRFTVITGPNGGGKTTPRQAHHGHRGAHRAARSSSTARTSRTSPSPSAPASASATASSSRPASRGMTVTKLLDIAAGKKLPMLSAATSTSRRWACARRATCDPRGGRVAVRRRGEAHRDRHHFGPRPEAGHLRRARGRHRFVELRQAHRDVPRHPRGPRRRSIVIISHQERIISLADEIVLLRDGQVAETGTPAELMPRLGFAARSLDDHGCPLSTPTELHLTEIPTTC